MASADIFATDGFPESRILVPFLKTRSRAAANWVLGGRSRLQNAAGKASQQTKYRFRLLRE
jgi:hypothetical protein